MSTPTSNTASLPRVLGPIIATAVVAGTVIGSGIFKKPQTVSANVPGFGLAALVWIAGGVLALFGALAFAEVATLYPRAGGNYVFLREGYGRLFGFLWGWVDFFLIRCGSIAALATMFAQSLRAVLAESVPDAANYLGYWEQKLLIVTVIVILAWINIRGVRWGGTVQLLITLVKIGSLLFLIALPFLAMSLVSPSADFEPRSADASRLQPVWGAPEEGQPPLLQGFASALLAVLWAYHGWMNIAPIAGEVKNPQRNLPLSLLLGVGIVIVLYLSVNLSYSLVLSPDEMKLMKEGGADTTVAIGFCRQLLGPIGVTLAAAAVMCSVFGALNGNLLVGPRLLFAMSEDGLAPRALGDVHPRYRTPALAIAVLAAWSCLLVLGVAVLTKLELLDAKKDHFDVLTDLAMFGAVIFETMAVVSIFVFRRKFPDAERPYRCIGYPVIPALYVLLPALVLGNMFINQQFEAIVGVGIVLTGAAVYFLQERIRNP